MLESNTRAYIAGEMSTAGASLLSISSRPLSSPVEGAKQPKARSILAQMDA